MSGLNEKRLTYRQRKHLPKSSFAEPGKRKYPIPNASHARNALARVSQHCSPSEKQKVRAAVHRKYPNIGENLDKTLPYPSKEKIEPTVPPDQMEMD